jgi:hypothetical protein
MVGLITRTQLKSALPRLIPAILELYKKDHDDALLATCSLHNLLNASLLSESGPPLLDFEVLVVPSFFVAKVPLYLQSSGTLFFRM